LVVDAEAPLLGVVEHEAVVASDSWSRALEVQDNLGGVAAEDEAPVRLAWNYIANLFDALPIIVMPAEAGIQYFQRLPGFPPARE
jgi:hypothetical protein